MQDTLDIPLATAHPRLAHQWIKRLASDAGLVCGLDKCGVSQREFVEAGGKLSVPLDTAHPGRPHDFIVPLAWQTQMSCGINRCGVREDDLEVEQERLARAQIAKEKGWRYPLDEAHPREEHRFGGQRHDEWLCTLHSCTVTFYLYTQAMNKVHQAARWEHQERYHAYTEYLGLENDPLVISVPCPDCGVAIAPVGRGLFGPSRDQLLHDAWHERQAEHSHSPALLAGP